MLLLLKLAWRNLFRNTRRTVLSGLAIGLGLATLIFFDAMMLGMMDNMVLTATATFPGQAQIHHLHFRKTLEVEDTVADADRILAELGKEPEVRAFAPRVLSFAMLSSAADVGSILLYGVEPEPERRVSRLAEVVAAGDYVDAGAENRILIGRKLAENLGVDLGDRLVLTVAQAGTGELSQEMFRVGGIFEFKVREMDRGMAFIPLAKAQQLLQLGGRVHEIAVAFKDLKTASDPNLPFWQKYSRDGNEALSWTALFPELKSLMDMSMFSLLIMAVVLFGIVSFGIMNTLFMSLYERMFEFGVLRAVGTRPSGVAFMILLESASLALVSIAIGIILGWGLTVFYQAVGIDYRGLEFTGVTIKDMIYPVARSYQYLVYPTWLFVFTVLVGIYPAVYAARLQPAKAMKRSL
ncbi:MAG: FtsX-like permease family protein [candidate division FCPU426 bacterium]